MYFFFFLDVIAAIASVVSLVLTINNNNGGDDQWQLIWAESAIIGVIVVATVFFSKRWSRDHNRLKHMPKLGEITHCISDLNMKIKSVKKDESPAPQDITTTALDKVVNANNDNTVPKSAKTRTKGKHKNTKSKDTTTESKDTENKEIGMSLMEAKSALDTICLKIREAMSGEGREVSVCIKLLRARTDGGKKKYYAETLCRDTSNKATRERSALHVRPHAEDDLISDNTDFRKIYEKIAARKPIHKIY